MTYARRTELEGEFDLMIALMAELITAQAENYDSTVDYPKWMFSQHDLAKKLFRHICSTRTLLEPSPFRSSIVPPHSFIDHSSVSALTRTCLENYLVMSWLLGAGDESLRDFRHDIWEYSGWKKRSKLVATTEEAHRARSDADRSAAALWSVLQSSPHFERLQPDPLRRLRKGNWSVNWNDLAVEADLHRTYFASVYPFLSGHVHSDYIGALQNGAAESLQDQYMLGLGSLQTCLMLIGHFSNLYANLFPPAKAVLLRSGEAGSIAAKWHIRAEDMDFIYTDAR